MADPSRCPLQPGWTITYRDVAGRLQDVRIALVEPEGEGWKVTLENGVTIPKLRIMSVSDGQRMWRVRDHGLGGHKEDPEEGTCPVCEQTVLTTYDLTDQDGQCAACWRQRWHRGFRALALLVDGIERTNSRFEELDHLFGLCDHAFIRDDFCAFKEAAERIREVMRA